MARIQLTMMGKLPYSVLQNAVFAHPTLAESLNNLFGHFVEEKIGMGAAVLVKREPILDN